MSRTLALIALLLAALALAACGSDDDGSAPAPPQPAASADPADFPDAEGQTLAQITEGVPEGPIFAPSTSQLRPGENRVGFVLFDRARKLLDASSVALYVSDQDGGEVRGPFVARRESLAVKTQYRSAQTEADLAGGDTFYVADVPMEEGDGRVLSAIARLDGRLVRTSRFELPEPQGEGPPAVGDRAIEISTDTAADVGGNLEEISTRIPPADEMHDVDLADALGEEPVVLLFATPALCQTRVCGPVVDIAEQVRAENGEGVTFIHQEIYVDNEVAKGFKPQVAQWRLPTEPWAFVIDREGRIAERFEGSFSTGELARAIAAVK